jgi:hypothetical protein
MKVRIYLAVLTRGKLDWELVEWIVRQIDMSSNLSCSYEIPVIDISVGTPLPVNANKVVKKFLASDCTRLLLLDDDITPPRDTIEKLFDDDKDIVGARVLFSQPHFSGPMSCAGISQGNGKPYRIIDTLDLDKEGPLMKVDFLGFACVMIKRKVFEKMRAPWFVQKFSEDGTELIKGTDTKFCERAKARGFEVYCDLRLLTGQKTTLNLMEIVNKMLKMKEKS